MKEIWVLTIKTSLPKTCRRADEMKTIVSAYDSFEKGRDAMREKIKEYAFSNNKMFDGEGQVIQLNRYINDGLGYFCDNDDEMYDIYIAFSNIQDILTEAFSGHDMVSQVKCCDYDDWNIAVKVTSDTIRFYDGEGAYENGYNPVLTTNIISMEKEQDYYLYIDDRLDQNDDSSELFIDLKKTTVL